MEVAKVPVTVNGVPVPRSVSVLAPLVEKVWAAHDCGKALNPLAVQGQIIGCIHMGLGQALQESFDYAKGQILNANLLDYRPISSKQMPEVEVFIVESIDPEGPFGAKEAGVGPSCPSFLR